MASPGRKPGDALRPSHHPRADARARRLRRRARTRSAGRRANRTRRSACPADTRSRKTRGESTGRPPASRRQRPATRPRSWPPARSRCSPAGRAPGTSRPECLLGRQIVGIVRRPRRRRWNLAERPRAETAGGQGVDLLGRSFFAASSSSFVVRRSQPTRNDAPTRPPSPRAARRSHAQTRVPDGDRLHPATASDLDTFIATLPASASISTGCQPSHARGARRRRRLRRVRPADAEEEPGEQAAGRRPARSAAAAPPANSAPTAPARGGAGLVWPAATERQKDIQSHVCRSTRLVAQYPASLGRQPGG